MCYALPSRSVIKLCGPDGGKFLNNLCTSKIQPGQLIYTYFLNNHGRYLYDGFLYMQDAENIYLDMNKRILPHFLKYIQLRKLRSKFDIIELKDYQVVYSEDQIIDDNLIFASRDPRDSRMGYRGVSRAFLGRVDNEDLYQDNRFKYVVVEGCDDMIYEKSIPIEYNGEEQNALSFDKGCYIGQEVISRAKYQGVVRKKVFLLRSDTADILPNVKGDLVIDDSGDKVGIVCSSRGSHMLALLNKEKMNLIEQQEQVVYVGSYSFICV